MLKNPMGSGGLPHLELANIASDDLVWLDWFILDLGEDLSLFTHRRRLVGGRVECVSIDEFLNQDHNKSNGQK